MPEGGGRGANLWYLISDLLHPSQHELPRAGRRHRLHPQAQRRLFCRAWQRGCTATSARTSSTRCSREAGKFASRRASRRSTRSATATARRSRTATSPRRRAGRKLTATWAAGRLERARGAGAMGRAGPAACGQCRLHRDVEFGRHGLRRRPDAHHGRRRRARSRTAREELKRTYLPQARLRRVDGHHAAHRAAGGLRSRRAAHARRARRRRQLPHHRAEDLHHLRRARPHRQHRPSRARAPARCAGRHARASRSSWCRNSWSMPTARPGARNDVRAHSIEHKLGIHGSPTCTMVYGDEGGATGLPDRRGEPRHGLHVHHDEQRAARRRRCRASAIAERATQQALAYARERQQGRRRVGAPRLQRRSSRIPTCRRMLLTMRALTRAARAICYATAVALDRAAAQQDDAEREAAHERASLLTPVAKAFATDIGVRGRLARRAGAWRHGLHRGDRRGAASTATRASRRSTKAPTASRRSISSPASCRWAAGRRRSACLAEISARCRGGCGQRSGIRADRHRAWRDAVDALERSTQWLLARRDVDHEAALAGATPYLRLFALALGGALLADEAVAAMRQHTMQTGKGAMHRAHCGRALLRRKLRGHMPARLNAAWWKGRRALTAAGAALDQTRNVAQGQDAFHHRRIARHRARDRAARRARRRQHRHRREDRDAASQARGHHLHRRGGDREGRRPGAAACRRCARRGRGQGRHRQDGRTRSAASISWSTTRARSRARRSPRPT